MNKNMRVIFQGRIMCHWRLFLWSSIALKWGRSDVEWWCSMMVLYDRYLPARFLRPLPRSLSLPLYPSRLILASPRCPNTKTSHFGSASLSTHYDGSMEACTPMCKDHKYVWSNAHMATHWHCFTMVKSPSKISNIVKSVSDRKILELLYTDIQHYSRFKCQYTAQLEREHGMLWLHRSISVEA